MKSYLISLLVCLSFGVSDYSMAAPKVLASIKPLGLIAEDLLGDLAEVDTLLAANTDPHHYALTLSDRRRLDRAELVLWLGPDFEQFLAKPLSNLNKTHVLAFTNPKGATKWGEQRLDPHRWLDPQQVMAMTEHLADVFSRRFPSLSEKVSARLAQRLEAIEQLDRQLRRELAPYRGRGFIAEHPAYASLVDAYGLNQLGAIQEQENIGPSARHMTELSSLVEDNHPGCLLVREGQQNNPSLQRWSTRWQLPVVAVDLLGADAEVSNYADLMARVAQAIHGCFGNNRSPN